MREYRYQDFASWRTARRYGLGLRAYIEHSMAATTVMNLSLHPSKQLGERSLVPSRPFS
jgi:hypothetical protein